MDETTIPDERLELLFTCCHPALALDAQVALTLRTLGGLTHRGDRARVPRPRADDGQAARAREAQDPGGGDPVPRAAGAPAARPARRGARGRLPDLQRGLRRPRRPRRRGDPARPRARRADARRARGARAAGADAAERRPPRRALRGRRPSSCSATRTARSGTATRSRRAGPRSTARSRSAAAAPTCCRRRSPSLHADDPPDWPQIAALYGELARLTGSPVVELNRAAAIAEAGDAEAALALADGLELDGYHYLHSTRAELLRRLDRAGRGARGLRARARAGRIGRRAPLPRAPAGRALAR